MVGINDALVEKYYNDNKENFRRPIAYRASHVLIMPFPPELIKNSKIEPPINASVIINSYAW